MAASDDNSPQIIAPDAYPQMLGRQSGARLVQSMRSSATGIRTAQAFLARAPAMRAAIRDYVDQLEIAGRDRTQVFDLVHEIRGFAETAGFASTQRICDILCHYMEECQRSGRPLDEAVMALHVNAVIRAVRSGEDDSALNEMVAAELSALVARKLSAP